MKPSVPPLGPSLCLSREKLTAYAAGRLSLADLESVAEHVTGCPTCTATLEAAPDATDPLVANLRGCQGGVPFLDESGCRRLEARARALGTDLTVDTPGPSVHECVTAVVPADASLPVPFGKCVLLAKLGQGGMGVVYQARDTALGRVVALKMLPAGVLDRPEEVARFYREAKAVSQVTHPNIVALYEYGEHAGRPFFTMDFAANGSLAKHRERFADPRQAPALMEKIARAVHHAHGKGILHRDLKPANVLLGADGEPRVSDFGLAKFLDSDEELTQKGMVVGTPAYMSPEQTAGKGEALSPRSDVWSLGVILYELLTEQRPFRSGAGKEVARAIRHDEPPPRELKPQLSRDLEAVVLKCLEKEPLRRYGSAEELADDLGRWLRGEPTSARPAGRWRQAWRTLRRNPVSRATAVMLAALGLVLVGGALAFYSQSTKTSSADEQGPSPEEAAKQRPGEEEKQRQQALEAIERDLKKGKEVTLVGKKGLPRWFRWAAGGPARAIPELNPTGELDVETLHLSLLELLPDPQQERYRLTAEVCMDQTTRGEVGVYLLGEDRVTERGLEHYCYALTFAEAGTLAGRAYLKLFRYRQAGNNQTMESQELVLKIVPLPPQKAGPWRRLVVDVTPAEIAVSCDGTAILKVVHAEWQQAVERWWGLQHPLPNLNPPPILAPRSRLGFFIRMAGASYRNVAIAPARPNPLNPKED